MLADKNGLLVVRRFRAEDLPAPSTGWQVPEPALPLSAAEVLAAYRGLDGACLWPDVEAYPGIRLEEGLAPLEQLPTVVRYAQAVCQGGCDIVFCTVAQIVWRADAAPAAMKFLGFDYGWLESEYSRFSVILHEVIFGELDEMRQFAHRLNANLLFDSLSDVEQLAKERKQHGDREGRELESVDESAPLVAVGIYDVPRQVD